MKYCTRSALSIQPRPTFFIFLFLCLGPIYCIMHTIRAGHRNLYKLVGTRPSSRREKDEERKKGKKQEVNFGKLGIGPDHWK